MKEIKWFIPIVGHPSAGKSTLIRILTGKRVAVGKKSGTTKKINEIPITQNLAIIDFPGFGKISRKSKSYSERIQQKIIDYLEEHSANIIVGILISDLSNIALVTQKFDSKGFIPIDYELSGFIAELSSKNTIVLGNKIDKLEDTENLDQFAKYFPKNVDFFPVSLKEKKFMEPFLMHLQIICDNEIGDESEHYFWKYY